MIKFQKLIFSIITAVILLLTPLAASAQQLTIYENLYGNQYESPYLIEPYRNPATGRAGFYLIDRGTNQSTYYDYDSLPAQSVVDQLNPQQNQTLLNACESANYGANCAPLTLTQAESNAIQLAEYEEAGGWALKLFNYAMGETAEGEVSETCLTCTFLGNFMIGLTNFSYATYVYFEQAFGTLVPVMMATWVAWKTAALFAAGGEDGRTYIYTIVKRMALFFLIWLAITVGNQSQTLVTGDQWVDSQQIQIDNPKWAWDTAGPEFLAFAFGLSSEIRDFTIQRRATLQGTEFQGGASYDAFRCVDVGENMSQFTSDTTILKFATSATEVACATERTHMIGIASALAVVDSSWTQVEVLGPATWGAAIVKLIAGLFMFFVFGLSAIWFTFLVLDVAVRGLITAAFLPVIAAMYLFEVTRGFATSAVRAMAGAMVTAVAISIVSTLAFYLLTRTVIVYNSAHTSLGEVYNGINMTPIPTNDAINSFREFIVRIQQSDPGEPRIPMDFSAPWFYYLVLSSLAIFSLGKKIIAMLEGMIGQQGASAMADNAMKLTRQGMSLGMMATGVGLGAAAVVGRSGGAAAAYKMGAGSELVKAISPFGNTGGGGAMGAVSTGMQTLQQGADVPNGE